MSVKIRANLLFKIQTAVIFVKNKIKSLILFDERI